MIKMLYNEARELLVHGYEATHDAKGIAKAYSMSKWTVSRLVEQERKTGTVSRPADQPAWPQAAADRRRSCAYPYKYRGKAGHQRFRAQFNKLLRWLLRTMCVTGLLTQDIIDYFDGCHRL